MKLKAILMATALLLPIHSVFAETVDEYMAGLKKETDIGNTEAQKQINLYSTYSEKANAGNAEAQFQLGNFYSKATAVDHYNQQAEDWLLKAFHQKYEPAIEGLINLYVNQAINGISVNNRKQQNELLQQFSDQGYVQAQLELGQRYLLGVDGIEKDYNKALAIFQKAANQGSKQAILFLSICYFYGYGVDKNSTHAYELIKQFLQSFNSEEEAVTHWQKFVMNLNKRDTDLFSDFIKKIIEY